MQQGDRALPGTEGSRRGSQSKMTPSQVDRARRCLLKELSHRAELEKRLTILYCFVSLPREQCNVVSSIMKNLLHLELQEA